MIEQLPGNLLYEVTTLLVVLLNTSKKKPDTKQSAVQLTI